MTSKQSHMRLYNHANQRLYINESERTRFIKAAYKKPLSIRVFALVLLYTGCRLSEVRELDQDRLQANEQLLAIRSLKKRTHHHIREIPIPKELVELIQSLPDHDLWDIDRITAYRWIKAVMREADITGPHATPKGLRHGFGIHAVRSGIQLNMLQKWMGHASIQTTAIYANAVGREEMELAKKMW